MHKLGDQWIEEIDGQEHMLKAVKPVELCQGCLYNGNGGGCWWGGFDGCGMGSRFIIKDLGILNEDGCLAEERTGSFPKIRKLEIEDSVWVVAVHGEFVTVMAYGQTKQEAIDAWNRRAM